jgi:hypothetical protein
VPALERTPEQRALAARIAAHTKWANTADTTAATAPARQAFLDRFEREVDKDAPCRRLNAPAALSTPAGRTSAASRSRPRRPGARAPPDERP